MLTVLRAAGLEFAIYSHDHPPPHVHVLGDGIAKILIGDPTQPPRVVYAKRMKNGDLRKALQVIEDSQMELLARWDEIHG